MRAMFNSHIEGSLTRYCDGELTPAERQRVDAHLETCARCRSALDEIQFSARLVRQLSAVSAPPSVWHGIDAAVAESRSGRSAYGGTRRAELFFGRRLRWAAALALIALVSGSGYWWTREGAPRPWEVAHSMGGARRMAAGEWVETSEGSKARIIVGTLGTVDVEPGTRVQLGQVRESEYRLALAHGTISAQINAPPRLFIVDTPASAVVDLGCAYTVTVGKDGAGELRMTTGWAALEFKGRESLVPAGAICRTKPGAGPGTPYFEDASAVLKTAVDDFDSGTDAGRALEAILDQARIRDTLTLWHLLSRVSAADRVRVYERIAAFVPPPAPLSRERILALDADALRKWREELAWKW
jgi:predicted anti-sigma-YlaC factor YlaD